jgi:hypothetical protein
MLLGHNRKMTITESSSMHDSNDFSKLVGSLRQLKLSGQKPADRPWRRTPAARVIDCVLSLNRRYDSFVVPRLQTFAKNYPGVCSITDLRDLISQFPSPYEFVAKTLDYRDPNRATVLNQVVNWLVGISGQGSREEQLERLERWAQQARPVDYKNSHIRGFALAGFQYLRMHFGADTAKPDVHIRDFVEGAIGHDVSAVDALNLFERASKELGVSARELDATIWRLRARKSDG